MDQIPPFEQRLLGQTLAGKYKVVEVQAGGAFGAVFRAEQSFFGQFVRPVAVKVSRQTGLTEDTAPHLFRDAVMLARILASGDHDGRRHLVPIFDMGLLPEHDGRAYMVMEYVVGAPLLLHIRAAGRVSAAMGLRCLKQICRAMALVHGQGAVHRDLKPDNIIVDRRGVVRVVDFGLAAFADRRLGFAPGSFGTFTYMAPETLQGRSTPASDVYSIGLLMYELFTGGGPHLSAPWSNDDKSNYSEERYRIKEALHFPPPSEVQNEIRNDYRWLDALILRCLEIDPARRIPDAGKLLSAIETCEAGGELPEEIGAPATTDARSESVTMQNAANEEMDRLFREVRRLLAGKQYDQVIDRLDVHRPAEWAVLDPKGTRTLHILGQAYLGGGDLKAARECLEQLRDVHRRQPLLTKADYAAALSDLYRCYRALNMEISAKSCQEEIRGLL